MARTCPRCRRTNPATAAYCHFDGAALETGHGADRPVDLATRPFRSPFVLANGRACANFMQLAIALGEQRSDAIELLEDGHLEPFLGGEGRADLAQAAKHAAKSADPERGLDDFLGKLPVKLAAAKLLVDPREVDLGEMQVGEDKRFELTLQNAGKRLLEGDVDCDEVPWLALGEGTASVRKVFRFADRMTLAVRIVGRALHAFPQPQQAEIHIRSNGGDESVFVKLRVSARPFPDGILAGVLSPRQLAEKARDAPKEAAALIENGAVAGPPVSSGFPLPLPASSGRTWKEVPQRLHVVLPPTRMPRVESSDARQCGQSNRVTRSIAISKSRGMFAGCGEGEDRIHDIRNHRGRLRSASPSFHGASVVHFCSFLPVT
jgi:hypothetical protein